jgi:hypothetical protein
MNGRGTKSERRRTGRIGQIPIAILSTPFTTSATSMRPFAISKTAEYRLAGQGREHTPQDESFRVLGVLEPLVRWIDLRQYPV